jgi:predicted RNA methylase
MTHSDLAALRGEPSYVWRAGQERRLQMIKRWAHLGDARVLDHGSGTGMYASQFRRRFTLDVDTFDIELERVQVAQEDTPALWSLRQSRCRTRITFLIRLSPTR